MGVWYCTLGDVKSALDVAPTTRSDAQVGRGIDAASRAIESLCHRIFYPTLDTRYFDWPNDQMGLAYRLWLDQNELISATSVTSGGIALTDYFLEPVNYGPPYNRLEVDLAGQSAFDGGNTFQRDIAITGLYGYADDADPAGTLLSSINATSTAISASDSSLVGVGNLLQVDAERMQVTGSFMISTGQTLQGAMDAYNNIVTVPVIDGTQYAPDEIVLLDAERMLITDIAGNSLIVQRAWDGTVLAPHSGSTIYSPRGYTVTRGAAGTTATSHTAPTPMTTWAVPGPVRNLCIAEAINALEQERSAYARVGGSGDSALAALGGGLADLRQSVYVTYGRKVRTRVA